MNRPFFRTKSSFLPLAFSIALLSGGGTLASIALGTVPAALAQDQPSGSSSPAPGARGHRMGEILMSLNLSDAQKTQVRAIMADSRKQNESVTDPAAKKANREAAMAKIDTVLTPAQRTQWHAKLDAMRQQNQTAHPQ